MSGKDWLSWNEYNETEPVTCNRCGATDLHWETGKWGPIKDKPVLCENFGNLHECPGSPPADADEFEIIPE